MAKLYELKIEGIEQRFLLQATGSLSKYDALESHFETLGKMLKTATGRTITINQPEEGILYKRIKVCTGSFRGSYRDFLERPDGIILIVHGAAVNENYQYDEQVAENIIKFFSTP